MHPARAPREPPAGPQPHGATGQDQDINSIWDSLGRLRTELRRMKHRLDDAAEPGNNNSLSVAAAVDAYHHHHHLPNQQQQPPLPQHSAPGPMPEDQAPGHSSQTSTDKTSVPATRRKVSRFDSKGEQNAPSLSGHSHSLKHNPWASGHHPGAISKTNTNSNSSGSKGGHSTPGRAQAKGSNSRTLDRHGGYRDDSPKRVDFSRAHHLREVNWDGTYQDSLAFPSTLSAAYNSNSNSSHNTDSTLTNSRDIRETDIRFLNFSRAPSNGPQEVRHPSQSQPRTQTSSSSSTSSTTKLSSSSTSPHAPPPSLSGSVSTFSVHLPSSASPSGSSSTNVSPALSSNPTSAVSSATSVRSQQQQRQQQQPNPSSRRHLNHQNKNRHQRRQPNDVGHAHRRQKTPRTKTASSSNLLSHQPPTTDEEEVEEEEDVLKWKNLEPPALTSGASRRVGGGEASHEVASVPGHGSAATSGSAQPKLTRVDLQTVGGGAAGVRSLPSSSDGASCRQQQHSADALQFQLPRVRRQVEERWATSRSNHIGIGRKSGSGSNEGRNSDRRLAQEDQEGSSSTAMEEDEDNWMAGSGDRPSGGEISDSGGGSDTPERGPRRGRMSLDTAAATNSPRRALQIKKPITADLKDNEIMLKLKERLKHQRTLAASSQSGSNDTSLADGNSSDASSQPPALPPRQPLTTASAASGGGGVVPKNRKVAAAHPTPSYRGFSDSSKETGPSGKVNVGTRTSSKKKSGGSGSSISGDSKKALQLQAKRHDGEGVIIKSASQHSATPSPALPPERPKKATRVLASSSSHTSGDKRHSKSGAKNIITTSSWRAGQELILRELGTTRVKAKGRTTAQQGEGHGSHNNDDDEGQDTAMPCGREPDGAEAPLGTAPSMASIRRDPVTEEVMAKAKLLSEDARNMLTELQLGPEITGTEAKAKGAGSRPAVKRKAPKVVESERQQQPREKARHYDPDSVRKFMARQKADRLKRQQEEREAHQKASERREVCMKELAGRQKKQAKASARLARRAEEEEEEGKRRRIAGGGLDTDNKENVAMEIDNDDDSTLTDDSEDDSTPCVTPREGGRDVIDNNEENTSRGPPPSESVPGDQQLQGGASSAVAGNFIEFQGQRLNMDKGNVLNRFSQIVSQRHSQPGGQGQNSTSFQPQDTTGAGLSRALPGEETAFALGSVNCVAKSNEERKQAIRATALTLQNRLAEEARKLGDLEWNKQSDADAEFVSRYDRIAGNTSEFVVFSSDLPGAQGQREQQAASRIQAAYRGHNARQAREWQLPSGHSFGQRLRDSPQGQEFQGVAHVDQDEASQLSDSSTFSEITATEPSDGFALQAPGGVNKKGGHASHKHKPPAHTHQAHQVKPSLAHANADDGPSRPTDKANDWTTAQADPYSVMSVFSRQSKYRIAGPSTNEKPGARPTPNTAPPTSTPTATSTQDNNATPSTDAFVASLNLTSLKQPVITSEERVVVGQTSSGRAVMARARYTRMEATVSEPGHSDTSGMEGSREGDDNDNDNEEEMDYSDEQSAPTPRGGASPQGSSGRHHTAGTRLATASFSDEDLTDSRRPHKHSTAKKSTVASYVRQVSDAGQETDVSQLSEDEPRSARHKKSDVHATPSAVAAVPYPSGEATAGQTEAGGVQRSGHARPGRLSPNSLGNKMAASLNYLESVEESLRQAVGMERTRAVALAQQESVALAQVLKARQQEHEAELHQLQLQAQQEALEAQRQLDYTRRGKGQGPLRSLLEQEDNRRPESRSHQVSLSHSSAVKGDGKKLDLSQSPGNRRSHRTSASASLASVTQVSTGTRSGRSRSTLTSVKTAEDSYNYHDSDSSIKTASDADARDSRTASVTEDLPPEEESYSMSFDESLTDEESFRQVLPSESHRKELRRQTSGGQSLHNSTEVSSHVTPYGDLSSLFAGEDSFSKFTADMVRQVMKEEEYRAQHQAALLSLREKALREKAKAELAWLHQLKQQPRDKRADDVFPNLDRKEKHIRRNLQMQQAEIRRLQEANKLASMERQRLLQQHEEIAKIKENTQTTLQKLQSTKNKAEGRLARPPQVHTEDEIDEASDVSEGKDTKSDSEMYRDKSPKKQALEKEEKQMKEKIQKLHLDHKYMTARQQILHDRRQHARELLEWKQRLDQEEHKVFQLEQRAMEAWRPGRQGRQGKQSSGVATGPRKEEATPARKATKLAPPSKKDDSNVISDHMLSSFRDEMAAEGKHWAQSTEASISEVISTQISASKSDKTRSRSDHTSDQRSTSAKRYPQRSPVASGSESSIPEEVPSGSQGEEKQKAQDSSDDTIINSSVNEDYADTFEHDGSASVASRKKLPVGKLLPQGNSPLPSPWSRKAGSESESEDSISHTETLSDASDYEVRIRQLSDELRRRRKEVEILKKERSRRQKDKLKAQEEAMKKQLEAYNNYITQLKSDKDNLEHDAAAAKSAVRPQIKQPKSGHVKAKAGRHRDELYNQSSSFEDMRDSTDSNQTSPSVEGKEMKLAPVDDKDRKKAALSLMDKISEGSESQSDKSSSKAKAMLRTSEYAPSRSSRADNASERTNSSSIAEVVEDASQLESLVSEKTASDALRIQTSTPAGVKTRKISESLKEEDLSYSMDFSENTGTLAQSHKGSLAPDQALASRGKSEADISEHIEEASIGSAKSPSISQHLKFNYGSKSATKSNDDSSGGPLSPPTMGIQESDSETESRVNSYHTSAKSEGSSRPSSERSMGSMSYSAEDDDEDEDIVSYGSDRTPVKGSPAKILPPVSAASVRTDEDISEHISASLPSISDKRQQSSSLRQDSQEMLNNLLGYKEDEEDDEDKTPVPTPREMELSREKGMDEEEDSAEEEGEEEENASLLMTDPLADFHLGDRVLVWGRKMGVLRFKGKVEFSPGIWAGVELDDDSGDSDGVHDSKRYFTCPSGHGVMVHGSDINAANPADNAMPKARNEIHSLDESLTTDQDDSNVGEGVDTAVDEERTFLNSAEASMLHSTPLSSPYAKGSDQRVQKPDATPVKAVDSAVADSITDHLTAAILEDTVDAMGKISTSRKAGTPPPPTLPKSKKSPVAAPSAAGKEEGTNTAVAPKNQSAADTATDGVMDSLLNEAISHMMSIKRRQAGLAKTAEEPLMNGDIDRNLVTSTKSERTTLRTSAKSTSDSHSFSKELGGGDFRSKEDEKMGESGSSMDPFQRPGSPVPGDAHTAEERQELNNDLAGLLGEYIEDDFGLEPSTASGQPSSPYPGEGDSEEAPAKGAAFPEDIPSVVPRTKEEIGPIVAQVVDIFWGRRRYGESLEGVEPTEDFLCGQDPDGDQDQDPLSSHSCRSWRRMLFDLAREVIQEIYKDEDKPDTPAWQKAPHPSHKYFKGQTPPTTVDSLRPVVQAAVCDLLDLNGNRRQAHAVNRWSVRKKKDAVDAVLARELGEEERGWVDYHHDEMNLKMNLTNSIFDSLLSDTVHTLNGIYRKKSFSHA